MAVCALSMLDGMEEEVTAAGGVLLLVLALALAWLSTHVADRGDHILGTILTAGAHASLIGLGGHDGYGGGPANADAPEQQSAPPAQDNKPDEAETTAGERGEPEGGGEGAEAVWTDLLLDIQSKQPQSPRAQRAEDEEEEEEEDEETEDEESEEDEKPKLVPESTSSVSLPTSPTTSISVRLKFLNDTEEVAEVEPQDTVGVLKSKCFSGQEHQIKLIYRGQLLHDPRRTLLSLNITNNSVIHCHVSQALREAGPPEAPQSGGGGVAAAAGGGAEVSGGFRAVSVAISTGSLVVPVVVVILAVVWYFRLNYRQLFTAPATISLVGVTVFFSFLIFGMHSR